MKMDLSPSIRLVAIRGLKAPAFELADNFWHMRGMKELFVGIDLFRRK